MYSTRGFSNSHLQDLLMGQGACIYKAHLALIQLRLSLLNVPVSK